MRRRGAAALLAVWLGLVCGGCQSEQDRLYSQVLEEGKSQAASSQPVDYDDPGYIGLGTPAPQDRATPVPGESLSGELTVRILEELGWDSNIQVLAREFMELHPGVEITVESDLGFYDSASPQEEEALRREFTTRLATELAAGEGDYLLFDSGGELNLASLGESGALEDLGPYLEQDPDLGEELFYQPVLEAFQIAGRQVMLPQSFAFSSVYLNRALLEELGAELEPLQPLSTLELLELYQQALAIQPELRLFYGGVEKGELVDYEVGAYLDLEGKTASFDSPKFVDFLAQLEGALDGEPEMDQQYLGQGHLGYAQYALTYQAGETLSQEIQIGLELNPGVGELVQKAQPFFAVVDESISQRALFLRQQPLSHLAGPFLLTDSKGQVGVRTLESFALPASLEDKELAWEFIKYCLSPREDTRLTQAGYGWDYTYFIPVTRPNWEKMVHRAAEGNAFGSSIVGIPGSFPELDGEQALADTEFLVSQPLVALDYRSFPYGEYVEECFAQGLTTPEQCAGKIQDRASIWLRE